MNKRVWLRYIFRFVWQKKRQLLPLLGIVFVNLNLFFIFDSIRSSFKQNFSGAISGVDLIVGAPNSELNLVLYALFQWGRLQSNIPGEVVQELRNHPDVEWVVPLSAGDTWQQFPVVAVESDFFSHMKVRQTESLHFEGEKSVQELQAQDLVIGYQVSRLAGVREGDRLVLAHGGDVRMAQTGSFLHHEDHPFRVAGVLKPTGTTWDYKIYVRLKDWDQLHGSSEDGTSVSALFVKLKNKMKIFLWQRGLAEGKIVQEQNLSAAIPSATLAQFWQQLSFFELILRGLTWVIAGVSFVALFFSLRLVLYLRTAELFVLRAIGLSLNSIAGYLLIESAIVLGVAWLMTLGIVVLLLPYLQEIILSTLGLWLQIEISLTHVISILGFGGGLLILHYIFTMSWLRKHLEHPSS